jgi:DNA-binding transcriptional LysR family regulator
VSRRHTPRGTLELRDEPIVTLTSGIGLRTVLENACAEFGFTPQIRIETNDLALLADLTAHGGGAALLPRSVADRGRPDQPILTLRNPGLRRTMVLVWHRNRLSAPGQAFLDLAEVRDSAPT